MGEFFHGWRRKTGCLALVIACVLMVGWIRTYFITDWVRAPFGKTTCIYADSFRSSLIFGSIQQASDFRWRSFPSSEGVIYSWNDQTRTALSFNGFGGGAVDESPNDPTRECDMWSCPVRLFGCAVYLRSAITSNRVTLGVVIPYWSIVLPLTLISAWLLLSKPRKHVAKSRSISDK
jgi:hypothetical protein